MYLRILFLATQLSGGTGGIRVFNNYLAKALHGLRYSLAIVTMHRGKGRVVKLLRKPIFIGNTLRFIFKFKPDLILCGHVNFSPLCMWIRKIFKIPYFTIVYGIDINNLKGLLGQSGIRNSNKIISISRFTKNKIIKQLPSYPKKDVFILPPTIDSENFKPKPKPRYLMYKWKINEGDKILLTIARLSKMERYKGYDKVVMAIKHIGRGGKNIKYILVGSGDDMDRIRMLIKDNNLEDRIILTGFIPHAEIVDYYNLCDVFVMPSTEEGFGIVFLEALACGKPVIAGNKDGSREAVLNGEIGLLVDPDNLDEIKDAIIKILSGEIDGKLLNTEYLRKSVIETYGFDKFKEKVKELIGILEQDL